MLDLDFPAILRRLNVLRTGVVTIPASATQHEAEAITRESRVAAKLLAEIAEFNRKESS